MMVGKVAVPYYGKLHSDKFGYERIYFFVETDAAKDPDSDISLGVWDKITESLPEWLKNNGVDCLICREEPEFNLINTIAQWGITLLNERNSDASVLMKSLMV